MSARQPDAETLLRTEHAVARVLTDAPDEGAAFSRILEAIGSSLQWDTGALWQLDRTALKRIAAWNTPEPFDAAWLHAGEGLPGAVYTSGGPAWIADVQADQHQPRGASAIQAGLHAAFAFPITGTSGVLGVIEFLAKEQREPDDALLATMTSLGGRIGQAVERWRSEARKTAILDAAFDAIITMDAAGDIVEVNRATETMFGYKAEDMVGRDLAELIIPPALREPHRHGLDRYLRTGRGRMVDHPLELPAMRADGSEFPAEIGITRPQLGGPPVFTGYIRDITQRRRDEQELRDLAAEQAALRRVAVVVAGEHDPQRVFAVATEEVARLLGAATSNMVRFEDDGTATVEGAWSAPGTQAVPTGTKLALDSPTAAARIRATGRPARVDDFSTMPGTDAARLRHYRFTAAVGAPIALAGRLWGAVMVSTTEPEPFLPGAEQRIADFAELVALALANAEAREELAASRARIVAAGDDERRRLERNLHDGAQQRLVALALMLRVAEAKSDGEAKDAAEERQRGARRRARRAARARARDPSLDPHRPRARPGAGDAGRPLRPPRGARGRGGHPAHEARRGRRLLHRRRGADERDQARGGVRGARAAQLRERRAARQRGRRRRGRGGRPGRLGRPRPRRPRRRARRDARVREPARRRDPRERADPHVTPAASRGKTCGGST